jgi:hypothetical protein
MANLDAKKVRFTRTGAFFEAPLGTPFPTDTSTPLSGAWTAWGFLGTDGPSRGLSSKATDIKAWQNNETIASIYEGDATYTIPAMETRKEIIETVFGTVVDTANGSYTITSGKAKVRKCFVLETVNPVNLNKTREMFVAECSEIADTKYSNTDAFVIVATFKVFGDITVIEDALKVAGSTGGTGSTGTIDMTVVQGTDANGNTLVVSGTATNHTPDDGVSVTIQPSSGPSATTTTSVDGSGAFTATLSVSPIVSDGDITVTASTLPDGKATGSTTFAYTV